MSGLRVVRPRLRLAPFALLVTSAAAGCENTLVPPRTAHLAFVGAPSSLVVGDTVRLTVVTRRENGTPADRPYSLASSDLRRATVSSNGLVTGVAPGTVTITASSDGRSARLPLVVRAAPPPLR